VRRRVEVGKEDEGEHKAFEMCVGRRVRLLGLGVPVKDS